VTTPGVVAGVDLQVIRSRQHASTVTYVSVTFDPSTIDHTKKYELLQNKVKATLAP